MKHNHQKNGFSKILGVMFVVAVLAAVVSMVYYFQSGKVELPTFFPTPHPTKTTATYQNYQYNFSVDYPSRFQLDVSGSQPDYFREDGVVHADIAIPRSEFPNTNLNSAHISLAAKNGTTLADCQTYVNSGSKVVKMTKTVTLNVGMFYSDMFDGAAAGTRYGTQIYRVLRNGLCIEAALTMGISNIENYDPSSGIQEVNQADVWNHLTAILATLKFTNAMADETLDLATEGTVQGHVDIGPNCPAQQQDTPCKPSPEAYEAVQILIYSSDRNQIISKTNLDAEGSYTINIEAGTYYVTYSSVYGFYQPPMKKITVVAGKPVVTDFSIDTGIR